MICPLAVGSGVFQREFQSAGAVSRAAGNRLAASAVVGYGRGWRPSSGCGCRGPGRVFAGQGHLRSCPVGWGCVFAAGPWLSGRVPCLGCRGPGRVSARGGAITVVYVPGARQRVAPGKWNRREQHRKCGQGSRGPLGCAGAGGPAGRALLLSVSARSGGPDCWALGPCARRARLLGIAPGEPGCVFAGWGHNCCLYPWGPGAWLPGGAAGVRSGRAGLRAGVACAGFVSSFSCGPLGPGATCPPGRAGLRSLGCVFAGRGHKRCLYPWAREYGCPEGRPVSARAGRGPWGRGVVSSLRVRQSGLVGSGFASPSPVPARPAVGLGCGLGLWAGSSSFLRSVRWAGVRWCGLGCLGSCGRVGPGLCRLGTGAGLGLVGLGGG